MKKKFVMYAFLLFTAILQAQTARQFTINLTDDGKANMVCFLAENPTGRAIVGIPLLNDGPVTICMDTKNKE